MSRNQRIAHITGFDNPFIDQLGGAGSYFAPKGSDQAPGYLGGIAEGFTIAFGVYCPPNQASPPWANFDSYPAVPPPGIQAPPSNEVIAYGADDTGNGWTLLAADAGLSIGFQTTTIANTTTEDDLHPDMIVLASYIRDTSVYAGPGGQSEACLGVNGDPRTSVEQLGLQDFVAGTRFALCGGDLAVFAGGAATGTIGGMQRTLLNSFWLTPGIPSAEQARVFFEASKQAGRVVPQAWAPARTVADPNPTTPAAPTGHHWDATDVDLSRGLGTVWTDRIGGVELELVGTLKGTEREVGRQGDFYYASL